MKSFEFDIFFNFNAEDHYLVEDLSQYFRDKGYTTFDRSVDQLPDRECDRISENDALSASKMMIAVLTENSLHDPSFENLTNLAVATHRPIVVMRFDDTTIPAHLADRPIVECSRTDIRSGLAETLNILEKTNL